MSLINLCILLLCIQPFVIYNAMFRERKIEKKSDLEFELSFLVIAPSFIYFYLDTFWYALLALSSISLLGVLSAKLFEKKAKRSLPLIELFSFMVAWLIIFSIGYGAVNLWGFVAGESAVPVTRYAVEVSTTDVPTAEVPLVNIRKTALLSNVLPSLYYLVAMICAILIKAFEAHWETKEKLSGFLLLILSVSGSIFPFFSEYYLLSLFFNFMVFIGLAPVILTYKEIDPSAGAIMFFYGYAFVMAAGFSLLCRVVMWLLSY